MIQMRRFIYLDSDNLNSYLAQIEKGLSTNNITEHQKGKSAISKEDESSTIIGDIGAKVLGIGANIKSELSDGKTQTEATDEFIKNIQEKALHDYSFDKVFDYIKTNNLIKETNLEIGDFISTSGKITLLDFDYFTNLFSENGAMKFSYESNRLELNNCIKALPKGQKSTPEIQKQLSESEKIIKKSEEDRKTTLRIIEVVKNTLPYKRFIMTENLLVTLDDNYFRDNPNIVAFKYGGNISLFGFVTNIVSRDISDEYDNVFSSMYKTVNSIMLDIFKEKDTIYIVHPIAVFY
jgi:hypothetical protein